MLTSSLVRRALVVGLVMLGVTAGALAQETLKYKWNKGDVIYYRSTQDTTQEMSGMGQTASNHRVEEYLKRFEVKDVAADGVATLELSFVSAKIKMEQGKDSEATLDTSKPESERFSGAPNLKPMLEALSAVVGEHVTVVIDVSGGVRKVEGMAKVIDKMQGKAAGLNPMVARNLRNAMGDDELRASLDQFFKVIPETPVKQGDTWVAAREAAIPASPGRMKVTNTFKFVGMESLNGASVAKIATEAKAEVVAPKEGENVAFRGMKTVINDSKGSGECYFDPGAGQLVKSATTMSLPIENSVTMDSKPISYKQDTITKLTFERVAAPEKTEAGKPPSANGQ